MREFNGKKFLHTKAYKAAREQTKKKLEKMKKVFIELAKEGE